MAQMADPIAHFGNSRLLTKRAVKARIVDRVHPTLERLVSADRSKKRAAIRILRELALLQRSLIRNSILLH